MTRVESEGYGSKPGYLKVNRSKISDKLSDYLSHLLNSDQIRVDAAYQLHQFLHTIDIID